MGTATDVVIPVHAKGLRPGASSRSRLGIRSEPDYFGYTLRYTGTEEGLKSDKGFANFDFRFEGTRSGRGNSR
jgi:hypothetical protein